MYRVEGALRMPDLLPVSCGAWSPELKSRAKPRLWLDPCCRSPGIQLQENAQHR